MSILDLIRAPAKNTDALRAKLAQLKSANPLADVPGMREQRTAELMAGNDKRVREIDAALDALKLAAERKKYGIELLSREITEAEARELDAERKKAKKRGETATRKMPDALAELERAFDLVREKLDAVNAINDEVESVNSILPESERLPLPEWLYRGGQPADKRTERSRRVVEEFWALPDGTPVPAKLVPQIRQTGAATGVVEVIVCNSGSYSLLEIGEYDRDAIASADAY